VSISVHRGLAAQAARAFSGVENPIFSLIAFSPVIISEPGTLYLCGANLKVEIGRRIRRYAVVPDLKMQMGTRTPAGRTDIADDLSRKH